MNHNIIKIPQHSLIPVTIFRENTYYFKMFFIHCKSMTYYHNLFSFSAFSWTVNYLCLSIEGNLSPPHRSLSLSVWSHATNCPSLLPPGPHRSPPLITCYRPHHSPSLRDYTPITICLPSLTSPQSHPSRVPVPRSLFLRPPQFIIS